MTQGRPEISFFLLFIAAVIVVNFFLFLPYFSVLFLALVLAIVFDGVYQNIKRTLFSSSLSALLTVLIVLIVIVGPLFLIFLLLFGEAATFSSTLLSPHTGAMVNVSLVSFEHSLSAKFPTLHIPDFQIDTTYIRAGLSWLLSHLSIFLAGFARIAFDLFVMLIALFYFLRDGRKFLDLLADLSPLQNSYDRQIFARITSAVNGVVKGNIVTGIAQGIITGAGFAIFGVPNPVLWGALAVLASLIPKLGPVIMFAPAVVYLFVTSGPLYAIGLVLWGVVLIGLVDNFLGPHIVHRTTAIHPFLVLMGALGGLALFGLIGFIAGPVMVALLLVLLELYPVIVGNRKPKRVMMRSKRKI